MEWLTAVKVAYHSLSSEKGRKILLTLIGVIIGVALMLFSIVSLPVLLVNLPQISFKTESEADKLTKEYVQIMVDYKYEIHKNIISRKQKYINSGKEVTKVSINYPALSLVIAYDNVINKELYLNGKNADINKKDIFAFLDKCMIYKLEGDTMTSKVKSVEEIARITFSNEDDRNVFLATYETLQKTDLDNVVPEVKFTELEYLKGGIELPYFNQKDKRWANSPYGSSTIRKSGCGIASMCMIVNGLNPDLNISPPELANWSASNGYYIAGAGTAWSFFPAVARKYGFKIKNLSRNEPQNILNELSKGNPILVSVSAGHFTRGGHLMVLRGVTEDGKILISDPWSLDNSEKAWDFSIILTESSTLSPYCFWSFSK